jgi:LacI family transcriptional regulator
MPAVTLRTIAKALGVSPMTVSLALRNSRELPAATRIRIRRTAETMGYRPDPRVRAWLESRREPGVQHGEVLAYLNSYPTEKAWQASPSVIRFHDGAKARAEELGFRWETFWFRKLGIGQRRLDSILMTRGVRGLIIGSFPEAHGHLRLEWTRYAAIAQGMTLLVPDLPRACNNYYETMGALLRKLHKLGYERPGLYIDENFDERCRHLWMAGFLVHTRKNGRGQPPPCIVKIEERNPFAKWLKRYRPDVVVAAGLHVLGWLRELGFRVPADIGFASFDRQPAESWSGISGMNHQIEVCGAVAVDFLAGRLSRNESGLAGVPEMIMTPAVWVEGRTTTLQ